MSEGRFPDLLETLVVKIPSGIVGGEPRALQAGGHRFDPDHVHQLNSRIRESESKALRNGVAVRILAVSEIVRQVDADKLNPGISGRFPVPFAGIWWSTQDSIMD